jgi:hypothetical protein
MPEFSGYNPPFPGSPVIGPAPPHILPPGGRSPRRPPVIQHRNQAERWLAAEPILPSAGVQTTITLRSDQGMYVALNRLILQCGSVETPGVGGAPTATGGDMSAIAQIDSILVKGATQLLTGQNAPLTTMATWSALRAFNTINLLAAGSWLRMEAGETVAIQFTLIGPPFGPAPGNEETVAHAAVPVILDCDKGKPAYAGFSQTDGCAVFGSPIAQSAGASNPSQVNPNLTWQTAGVCDLSNIAVSNYSDAGTGVDGNVPLSGWSISGISSLLTVDRSEMIVGTPDNAGALIEVPLSAYTVSTYGKSRSNPFCRLPSQEGSSGNSIIVDVQSRVAAAAAPAVANHNASASAPFYPTSGGPLKDCPGTPTFSWAG